MQPAQSFHQHAARWAEMFAAKILARDGLHLSPRYVSRAAALRLKQGIAALEAYLRRLLFLLALQIEHGLKPDTQERVIYARRSRKNHRRTGFRALPFSGIDFDFSTFSENAEWGTRQAAKPVRLGPLLQRLKNVRALLADPVARARRLAFHLSRKQPGPLLAPGASGMVRGRDGTEFAATYRALAQAIGEASRARPPPLGPVLRARPRIRTL